MDDGESIIAKAKAKAKVVELEASRKDQRRLVREDLTAVFLIPLVLRGHRIETLSPAVVPRLREKSLRRKTSGSPTQFTANISTGLGISGNPKLASNAALTSREVELSGSKEKE